MLRMTILLYLATALPQRAQDLVDRSAHEPDGGKAVELLEEAVTLAPDSAELRRKLADRICEEIPRASVFRMPSMIKRCRSELELSVDLAPDDAAGRQMLLLFYLNAPGILGGGADKAREELARIEKLDAFHGHIARANWALHDKKDAVPELNAALQVARSDADRARALRALALQQLDKPEVALDAAEQARRLDPAKPVTWYTLGRVYAKAGRAEDANEAFRRFLQMEDVGMRADDARKRLEEAK